MNQVPQWIWSNPPFEKHSFCDFRRKFTLPEAGRCIVRIAAETDFVLFMDGREILRGQYQDYPEYRRYSQVEVDLTSGSHCLAVKVYYCGEDFQTTVASPVAGLWYSMLLPDGSCIVSDPETQVRRDNALLRDRLDKVDGQVGFCFGYDGRLAIDAADPALSDQDWSPAVTVPELNGSQVSRRPVTELLNLPAVEGVLIKNIFIKCAANDNSHTYAELVAADQYDVSPDAADGRALLFDLQGEEFGYLELFIEAAPGTIIDISHGEHIADGRVRNLIGVRNFTDRYIAGGRRESYTLFRRLGCRYIQLNIRGTYEFARVEFHPLRLDLPVADDIVSSRTGDAELYRTSLKTLQLCMDEHYMDCPWREQALYTYDSRNQMLFGYGIWGNADYVRANLGLLGRSVLEHGLMAICSPCRITMPYIPVFSLVYAPALQELFEFTGQLDCYEENRLYLEKIAGALLSGFDPESGLYNTPAIPGAWNFYEWSTGLDGLNASGDCTDFSHLAGQPQLDGMYNIYLIEFLGALAALTGNAEYTVQQESLRKAVKRCFWDEKILAMRTSLRNDDLHEAVQVLALYTRSVPEEHRETVWKALQEHRYEPITLSTLPYMVRAALEETGELRTELLNFIDQFINDTFGPMLEVGDTLWETADGEKAFDKAGSMCHGWSSVFAYFFQRAVLGVKQLSLTEREYLIDPYTGNRSEAAGSVCTANGVIKVHWQLDKSNSKLSVQAPAGFKIVFSETARKMFRTLDIQQ